jgi:hypothetical protein
MSGQKIFVCLGISGNDLSTFVNNNNKTGRAKASEVYNGRL